MNKKKLLAISFLALSNTVVFAEAMGPICTPGNVTIACATTAWDFGVHALYLQPMYNNELSWTTQNVIKTVTHELITENPASSQWVWGAKLEGSYHFNTGNDLNLNWYHLGRKDKTLIIHQQALLVADTSISSIPSWDGINLEMGQHIDFGGGKNIRIHGGIHYAKILRIDSYLSTIFDGLNAYSTQGYFNYSYNGFGPRAGADIACDFENGFGLFLNTAAAILTGTSKEQDNYGAPPGETPSLYTFRTTMIVPELEAKLGMTYNKSINNGTVTADAGYMWINYFGPLNTSTPQSNFGVQGPFVGLSWVGTV